MNLVDASIIICIKRIGEIIVTNKAKWKDKTKDYILRYFTHKKNQDCTEKVERKHYV